MCYHIERGVHISELIHRRATVANIAYHIVWSTKRRKRVLVPELAQDLQAWLREAARRHGFEVHMAEIGNRDHVHCLASAPPDMPVSSALRLLKGCTARKAFEKYAFLDRTYPKRHL